MLAQGYVLIICIARKDLLHMAELIGKMAVTCIILYSFGNTSLFKYYLKFL